jgi:hypothetical protein
MSDASGSTHAVHKGVREVTKSVLAHTSACPNDHTSRYVGTKVTDCSDVCDVNGLE